MRQNLDDYHNGHFAEGTVLTFENVNFVPYHGGYTVCFAERKLYLQEYENAGILQSMWDYFEPASPG